MSLTAAPRPFKSGGVDVEVTFQDNKNPVATISFVVCINNNINDIQEVVME